MSLNFDASDVSKTSDVRTGGGAYLDMAGGWHFIVIDCDWIEDEEFFNVELEVLAGTVDGNEGKKTKQRYYAKTKEGETNPGLLKLALATKVVQPKTKREMSEVELAEAIIGRTFKARTYMPKGDNPFPRVSMDDQWAVDDKDAQAKAIPTGTIPASNGHATNGNGSQDAQPAAAGGGWDDIV